MRDRTTSILFAGQRQWTVVSHSAGAGASTLAVDVPQGATAVDAATLAVQALRSTAPAAASVTLAWPSAWCLCAEVAADDIPRASRQTTLVYRLEERLPLAAEEFVADFVAAPDETALGVAAELRLLEPVVRAIEAAGVDVDVISPAALLAGQAYLASVELHDCDLLLFPHAGQIELLVLDDGRLAGWDLLPADAEDVAIEVSLHAMAHPPPLRVACASGTPEELVARLRGIAQLAVTTVELPAPEEAAAQVAAAIDAGDLPPVVQLRRDALGSPDRYRPARGAIRATVAARVVFSVCLCAALAWRAHGYRERAGRCEREQAEIYARAFDGRLPPEGINVASRMSSEERRLRSLAGESVVDAPSQASALEALRRLLARLPDGRACEIAELRLNDDKLYLAGTAPSHADAAALAAALAGDPGFRLESPRTEQLPGGAGVAVTLNATVSAAASSARSGEGR
jgi:hypothetical protein